MCATKDYMNEVPSLDLENLDPALQVDFMHFFEAHCNPQVNAYYRDRAERNRFAAEMLKTSSVQRILNLGGGGRRHLQYSLATQPVEVYEVDVQGDCDLKVDLDSLDKLPFADNSFDVVCAFDVLEHLENFHLLNSEMYRIATKYVLISLPNSAVDLFLNILKDKRENTADAEAGVFSKFYGLPLVRPSDRHRWWLSFHDIIRYYAMFSAKNKSSIEFWVLKPNLKKRVLKAILGPRLYNCFFSPHVWIKLSKPPTGNKQP